jgi:hypothetical protein
MGAYEQSGIDLIFLCLVERRFGTRPCTLATILGYNPGRLTEDQALDCFHRYPGVMGLSESEEKYYMCLTVILIWLLLKNTVQKSKKFIMS